METALTIQAMRDSISNVIETMFFQMVQISEAKGTLHEWLAQEHTLFGATLNFVGPWSGSFYLLVPAAAADKITAHFLGIDTNEIDDNQRKDTVKETLNMIGGGLLSVCDPKGSIKLGIPELIETKELYLDMLEGLQGHFVRFETEGYHLAAGVVAH